MQESGNQGDLPPARSEPGEEGACHLLFRYDKPEQ